MGHWGQCPHIPGMAGNCLVTLGGHTHTTTTTFGAPDSVFDGLNCGSGGIRWCAHHPQQLESPWGIGGNAPSPQRWQGTAWSPWEGTHTRPRPHLALPTPLIFDGSNCGSGVIRWCAHHLQHIGSPWGIGGNDPTPQGWQDTAWSPWGPHTHNHNHIQRSRLRIRRFELQFGCRTVVCTSSSASRVAISRWGQSPYTPEMAGHSLVTLGATHTPPQPHSAFPTPYSTVRIAVRVSYGGVHIILSI
jgi:hypothetical protein